eukprot:TRINITY_DN19776_c0_g1_i1.p1 TRINITY_DN19776_c0_g1~~TRINITY_DN19776_c0_g1_i1.p1  ORF type:complete len:242 (-),score=55.98 TRINITY_DN19776_c0_g1_i1:24-749(-)
MCFVVRGVTVPAAAVDADGLGAAAPPVTDGEGGEAVVVVPALFSGDALFLGGCGRLFDGTPAEALTSLDRLVAALPPATAVYCGHEYTGANLRFAAAVEPRNAAIAAAADRVRAALGDAPWGDPRRGTSVPGWMGVEVRVNPFLRVREPTVAAAVGGGGTRWPSWARCGGGRTGFEWAASRGGREGDACFFSPCFCFTSLTVPPYPLSCVLSVLTIHRSRPRALCSGAVRPFSVLLLASES